MPWASHTHAPFSATTMDNGQPWRICNHPNLFQYGNDYAHNEILKINIYMNVWMFALQGRSCYWTKRIFQSFPSEMQALILKSSRGELELDQVIFIWNEENKARSWSFWSLQALFSHLCRVPVMSHHSTKLYHHCKHFPLSFLWACWWRSAGHMLMLTVR